MSEKTWHLKAHNPEEADRLAKAARTSPVVAQLLLNRGVRDAAEAIQFLNAPLTTLHAPNLLPGVSEAAERIARAIADKKKICVYGDYDVDGTTGIAILLGLFKLINASAEFYVPNRMDEGYGLNLDAMRELANSGVQLIITVDCGITAVAEAEEAKKLDVELIITDHHEMRSTLPDAAVLVHPRLPGSTYPCGDLSGAGVAFKLAWAIAQRVSGSEKVPSPLREYLVNATGLAALGLVADVVPLRGENRAFVRQGLVQLRQSPSPGIKALLEVSGLVETKELRAEDIGFKLGPRLNAAGRLECARLAVDLLTTPSPRLAKEIAAYLDDLNQQRQTEERRSVTQAREMAEEHGWHEQPGIVLASPDWHQGVIGIVAARIAERYGRPTLLISQREGDEPSPGSGRSVPGFPLHEALRACDSELLTHGGHAAAAGFKVLPSRIDALREKFAAYAATRFGGTPPPSRLVLDTEAPLNALTYRLVRDLDKLEPFGQENPRPKFLASGLKLEGTPKKIGNGERHLSFRVRQGGTTLRCIAWGMAERMEELTSSNGDCCVAFTPKLNEWQGFTSVDMEVLDFRAGSDPKLT